MGFFSKILDKLGMDKKAAATTMSGPAKSVAAMKAGTPAAASAAKPAARPMADMAKDDKIASPAVAISRVDVVTKLEDLSRVNPAKLNWKTSIVDLLKLLDLDSGFEARKELATELGCPAEVMGDSSRMNTWLHKEVLGQIAKNGGNIPKELLN